MTEQSSSSHCGADNATGEMLCPQCQQTNVFWQYHNIDASLYPQWKADLLEGTLFVYTCPHCGYETDFCYPCRYLDEDAKLGIVLNPNIQSDPEGILAQMNQQMDGLSMPGYLHRACANFFAMQELVRIREAGLDDRVIQLLKPLIIGQLQSIGKEVWNGFFVLVEEPDTQGTPLNGVVYLSNKGEEEEAYTEPVYSFDIHLTNGEVLYQGINQTAYYLCASLLQKQALDEEDGRMHLYDLSWAIHFHNTIG